MKWPRSALCGSLLLLAGAVFISQGVGQGHQGHQGHQGMMKGMMGCHQMGMGHAQQMIMDCFKKSGTELSEMLKSDKVENRFAAAFAIGEKRLPMTGELIGLLTDKSDPVRQAGRRSLILVSYNVDVMKKAKQKGAVPRAVDFGPAPNASVANQKKAAKSWTTWAEKNKSFLEKLQQQMEPGNDPSSSGK